MTDETRLLADMAGYLRAVRPLLRHDIFANGPNPLLEHNTRLLDRYHELLRARKNPEKDS